MSRSGHASVRAAMPNLVPSRKSTSAAVTVTLCQDAEPLARQVKRAGALTTLANPRNGLQTVPVIAEIGGACSSFCLCQQPVKLRTRDVQGARRCNLVPIGPQ